MAKKAVASMQKGTKNTVKVIRAVKSKKGAYSFKAEFIPTEQVDAYLKK